MAVETIDARYTVHQMVGRSTRRQTKFQSGTCPVGMLRSKLPRMLQGAAMLVAEVRSPLRVRADRDEEP